VIIGVDQKRVAVGLRLRRFLGSDIAAGAADILDKELLAEMIGEFLRDQAGEDIDRTEREGNVSARAARGKA
jgi:Arc/MetJ family transcription regulator